jgi:soluble lytic murein transglycosylase
MTEWCRRVIAASPGSNAAGTAYWMLVWNRYRRNDLTGARDWADKALASAPPVPWDYQARLLYWKGRIAAAQGDGDAGRQAWADLIAKWPSTYYGLVAQSGGYPLAAKYAKVASHPEAAADAPPLSAVWKHPAIASALFAYAAGEDALAESLLQEALVLPLPKDTSRELAALFLVLNEHHLQQRLMANQGPYELVEAPIGNSPAWRQAFPPAYWDIVVDEAHAQDVSPYFILAVMREESRFKVKADSRAGAKGLMQVMPSTALELARKRRINLSDAALLLPEFNIPIGALYLRDVLRRFDWNPIFAAAAYNAGPGSVMRWAKEWGEIPFDEFVERIPFDETQSYVRRVYSSYVIYRQLYP